MENNINEVPTQVEETPSQVEEKINELSEEIKEETDKRDSEILTLLRDIHTELVRSNEHHVEHLIEHSTSQNSPAMEQSQELANDVVPEEKTTGEAVDLEINEPHDMIKEEKKPNKRKKAFKRKR